MLVMQELVILQVCGPFGLAESQFLSVTDITVNKLVMVY